MYLGFFRENAPLIGLALAVVALAVAADADDLLVGLTAFTGVFLVGLPLANMKWRWHLLTKKQRIWEVSSNAFVWIWVGYAMLLAIQKDETDTWTNYGLLGGMLVLVSVFLLFAHFIPLSAKRRKDCPECCNTVHMDARVCQHCGYRWKPPLPAQ